MTCVVLKINLRSSKAKVPFDLKQTINESSNYINATFIFINASFIYKNKASVYRFLLDKNNFGSKEKEVCNKETVTYLLTNFISFYKEV